MYLVHYECVRRNPKYRKLYKQCLREQLTKWQSPQWDPVDSPALYYERWGILAGDTMPDPFRIPPLDQALKRKIDSAYQEPFPLPEESFVDPLESKALGHLATQKLVEDQSVLQHLQGILALVYFPEGTPHLRTTTALNVRMSKADLMAGLERFVDLILEGRAKAGLKQQRSSDKIRWDQCPEYVAAYDLRNAGKTYKQIGLTLWNGQEGDLEKRARDYVRRGKTLVKFPPLISSQKFRSFSKGKPLPTS